MNLKKTILTSAVVLFSSTDSQNIVPTKVNENIFRVLIETPKKEEKPVHYTFDLSKEFLEAIDSIPFDRSEKTVFTRHLEWLRDTPLFMKWTKRHLWEFLWYTQYDSIIEKYNEENKDAKVINDLDKLSFPLIYDGLKNKLASDLPDMLAQEKFVKYRDALDSIAEVIVVTSLDDGSYVVWYYVDSKLFLASYCSIGNGKSTPQWLFDIKRKIFDKRSFKYKNAPMPYSLHLDGNIFIHQGYSDGNKRSKGCVRIPWLYQEILYYHAKHWTKVVIAF